MMKRRLKAAGSLTNSRPTRSVATVTDLLEQNVPWKTHNTSPGTPTRGRRGSTTGGGRRSRGTSWNGSRFDVATPPARLRPGRVRGLGG